MARVKIHYGKKENAVALISDGIHSRVDVWSSVAVFVGLLIYPYWNNIDALLALLVGLYVIKESMSMGKEMTDSLLDVTAGEEIEQEIKKIIEDEGIKLESLKTQKRGLLASANVKIVLPKNLKLEDATKITTSLKERLLKEVQALEYVVIQIESEGEIHSENYYNPKDQVFHFGIKNKFHWSTQTKKGGEGPGGFCVCPSCGYKSEHKKGVPCSTLKCPNCKTELVRI
jgi:divalent metal cation (Fe/Co/Zn/Cd) transporter